MIKHTPAIALMFSLAPCGGHHDQPDASSHDSQVVDGFTQHDAAAIDAAQIDAPAIPDATAGALPTVFTIVLENHDYAEIVGSPNAPYINSLIATQGLATNYK